MSKLPDPLKSDSKAYLSEFEGNNFTPSAEIFNSFNKEAKKFSLRAFEHDLLAGVKKGASCNLRLQLHALLEYDEVKHLFKKRGIDILALEDGLNFDDNRRTRHQERVQKRRKNNLSSDSFERLTEDEDNLAHREERVHDFINDFRRIAITKGEALPGPVEILKSILSGYEPDEYCKLDIFRDLKIAPQLLFPEWRAPNSDLKEKEALQDRENQTASIWAKKFAQEFKNVQLNPLSFKHPEKGSNADDEGYSRQAKQRQQDEYPRNEKNPHASHWDEGNHGGHGKHSKRKNKGRGSRD
jgi:hypothetical protein